MSYRLGVDVGGTFTDLANQQCWYPSDNSDEDGEKSAFYGAYIGPRGTGSGPRFWRCLDAEVSHMPGVFTAAYMWESNARKFALLGKEPRGKFSPWPAPLDPHRGERRCEAWLSPQPSH